MDLSTLPKAAELTTLGTHAPRWSPSLLRAGNRALHTEVLGSSRDGGAAGFALALAFEEMRAADVQWVEEKPFLWVQDQASIRLTGRPYVAGLHEGLRTRVVHVAAPKAEDALFALEEGLRCRDFAFVLGEIAGDPKAMDFTASRRLSLAAERHGSSLFLVRHDAARNLSAARMRWQVRPAPSNRPVWNREAPGMPAWHAELFRARAHAPGEWLLRDLRGRLSASPPMPVEQDQEEASRQEDGAALGAR